MYKVNYSKAYYIAFKIVSRLHNLASHFPARSKYEQYFHPMDLLCILLIIIFAFQSTQAQ